MTTGSVCTAHLPRLLSTSLAVPGTASAHANTILTSDFDQNIEGTFSVVFVERKSGVAGNVALPVLQRRFAQAARVVPTGHASTLQRGNGVLYGDISSSLGLQQAASYTPRLRLALDDLRTPPAYVTGAPALQHDITPVLAADLRNGEAIAAIVSLVLLTLALGVSGAVMVPFLVALGTVTGALAIVYGLAHWFLMVLYIPNLVQLIGLGLAVDYSLLIVHRFRQEADDPTLSVEDAIANTMATAGRTVALSGMTVAIGLCALLAVPVPFVRSLGVAGCLVPLVSIAAALTLQPALLSVLGRRGTARLSTGRLGRDSRATRRLGKHGDGKAHVGPERRLGLWEALAGLVMRRPVAVLGAAGALIVAAAAPAGWLEVTPASVTAIPQAMEAAKGIALLRHDVGPGVFTPLEVVVDSGRPGGGVSPAMDAATLRLAHELLAQKDVFVVAIGTRAPYVSSGSRYRQTVVVERHDFGDEASQDLVRLTRAQLVPAAHFPAGARVYLGGAPAQGTDFLDRTYAVFPWVVLIAAALTYGVLARAFRSLLLPLMAIALDALSVASSYGLVVLAFRSGLGRRLLGLYHVPQVEGWVPVFLFAMLFGLSMDYEVFFVTRMRESWDRWGDNRRAVTEGLSRTGRVVSAAALIMVGALAGLVAGRVAGLQELGAGLALGVLVDATVVRGLLMPALMALAGGWNWWLPRGVARLLRVEASPRVGAGSEAVEHLGPQADRPT